MRLEVKLATTSINHKILVVDADSKLQIIQKSKKTVLSKSISKAITKCRITGVRNNVHRMQLHHNNSVKKISKKKNFKKQNFPEYSSDLSAITTVQCNSVVISDDQAPWLPPSSPSCTLHPCCSAAPVL